MPNETNKVQPGTKTADWISKCEGNFEEAKQNRSSREKMWREYERIYMNEMRMTGPKAATKMQTAIGLATIQTELPIVKDFLPGFDCMARHENDTLFAQQLNDRKTEEERLSDYAYNLLMVEHDNLLYGNGIMSILPRMVKYKGDGNGRVEGEEGFNPATAVEKNKFDGIDVECVDPYTWYPSPRSVDIEIGKKSRYQIFATPTHVDDVERDYGKKVEPEGFMSDGEHEAFVLVTDKSKKEDKERANCVLVKEQYILDKKGQTRVTVWANGVELVNEILELPRIPYFLIGNYKSAHAVFGISEIHLIKTQIKVLNETMSSVADNIKKTANPVRKILRTWFTSMYRKIRGVPGEEVVVGSKDDISWETPPNVPAYTFSFIEMVLNLVDLVTGIHDVQKGKKPGGVTAAAAIAELQEAAQARIRFKIAHEVTRFVQQTGSFFVWILQHYEEEIRSIRKDDGMGKPVYVEYNPLLKVDSAGVAENAEGFDESTGRTMRDTEFDIDVVPGHRAASGRLAEESIAMQKFDKGIYGIEDYLAHSNEKDKQGVQERFYIRQGIKEVMEKQQSLNDAYEQIVPLVEQAYQDRENWIGSEAEEQLGQLLQDTPEFYGSEEFTNLPPEFRSRLAEKLAA